MFSGGVGSWAAAKRVAAEHGTDRLWLIFADTKMEDPDLYRFLDEAAADVGGTLVKLADGRTPWEVFKDKRFLGNTRIDPCSRILKRELIRGYLDKKFRPSWTVIYLGIDWTEDHRFKRAKGYWAPWEIDAPMCRRPLMTKPQMLREMETQGIKAPVLYDLGFPHNNCGGFCVKAGQAHFAHLLRTMPERFGYHEAQEEALRCHLGKDVAILRDRRGGETKPLTLRTLRARIEGEEQYDLFEWGGCGCFTP